MICDISIGMDEGPPCLKTIQELLLPVQPEMVHLVNNVHMDCGVGSRLCPRCRRIMLSFARSRFRKVEASVGFEPGQQRFGACELVLCSRDEISVDGWLTVRASSSRF